MNNRFRWMTCRGAKCRKSSCCLFVFLLYGWGVMLGQTVPATVPTSAPAGAEQELGRLRAENWQLRAENEELRAEVKGLREQVGGKNAAIGAATATAPAARAFATMLEVLAETPADIRPKPNPDWYKYTASKFVAWWKAQLVGMEFERKMVVGKVNVWRNSSPRPGREWVVYPVPLGAEPFTYFGVAHKWTATVPIMYVDEVRAREWERVKEGTMITVKGTIGEVTIELQNQDKEKMPVYRVILRLRDAECVLPK